MWEAASRFTTKQAKSMKASGGKKSVVVFAASVPSHLFSFSFQTVSRSDQQSGNAGLWLAELKKKYHREKKGDQSSNFYILVLLRRFLRNEKKTRATTHRIYETGGKKETKRRGATQQKHSVEERKTREQGNLERIERTRRDIIGSFW
jgi:hypothetical protein